VPFLNGLRTLVIIPAYNEAKNLPMVIGELRACCQRWDVVVVDDGSTDCTADVARSLNVPVLQLPFNLGIGAAVQTGLIYAHRLNYDICVQIDGDAQHAVSDSIRLVDVLQSSNADLVVGSRFNLKKDGFQSSLPRRLGISVLILIIKLLTGQSVTDPTSGQRAFGRRAVRFLAPTYPQEYPEPEVVYMCLHAGLCVLEAPVRMRPRRFGKSSIDVLNSLLYVIKVVIGILIHSTRRYSVEEHT